MQTPLWICHDGTAVRVSVMSAEHILNVIRYLRTGEGEHGPMIRTGCSGFTNGEWLQLLDVELRVRARSGSVHR
jgi:hypothetical protein